MGRLSPTLIRRSGVLGIYAFFAIFCLILTATAHAAEAGRTQRVLIISTGGRFSPGLALIDQGVLEALAKNPSPPIETYAENLDIIRFPPDRFQRIFRDYLTEKYAERPPDLVILAFVGNLRISGKLLHQLFPGTPVIAVGLTEEEFRTDEFGPLVSGLAQCADPRSTLELILRLHPETRRIVESGVRRNSIVMSSRA
jgi:hypothetical protein